jgi:hypothetical protein
VRSREIVEALFGRSDLAHLTIRTVLSGEGKSPLELERFRKAAKAPRVSELADEALPLVDAGPLVEGAYAQELAGG